MRKKSYRGFHTGNTLRQTNERLRKSPLKASYSKKSLNDTEGIIRFTHFDYDNEETAFKFDGQEFLKDVPYSIKKKKRWLLSRHIQQRLEDDINPFYGVGIELAEGHVIGQRGPRAKYLLRKMPGDSEIRECQSKHGFLCLNRERGMMQLLEEEERELKRSGKEEKSKKKNEEDEDELFEDGRKWIYFEIKTPVRRNMLDRLIQEPKKDNYYGRYYYRKRDEEEPWKGRKEYKINYLDEEFLIDDELSDDELDNEVTARSDSTCRLVTLEDLVVKKTINNANRRRRRTKSNSANDVPSSKSRKIVTEFVDDKENREENDSAVTDPDPVTDLTDPLSMVASRHEIVNSLISPDQLFGSYGNMYIEGGCYPRKFVLDLSHSLQELAFKECDGPVRKNVYLVFEEMCTGAVTSEYDIYLNIDVENINVTSVFHWCDRFIDDLHKFVDDCAVKVMEKYGENIRSRRRVVIQSYESPSVPFIRSRSSALLEDVFLSTSERKVMLNNNAIEAHPSMLCDENGNLSCGICFDSLVLPSVSSKDCEPVSVSSGCGLSSCGHCFCNDCWRMHLISTIRTGMCDLKCPAIDCSTAVDLVTVLRHVSLIVYTPHVIRLEANDVDLDPTLAWCPAPKCGRLIRLTPSPDACHSSVKCHCGHWFCFTCREEAHWPASCEAYQFYTRKMKSLGDTETLLANDSALRVRGKNCPRCKKFIEKNGGCPHMHCSCGYDFCWTCGAAYYDPEHEYCDRDRPGPNEWKAIGVAEAITTHSEGRKRDYSEALKWRFRRLHIRLRKDFLLNVKNLRKLMKCKYAKPDGGCHNQSNFVEDAQVMNERYQELIRVVEFLFASMLNVNTAHLLLVKRVRYLAVTLASLVTEIRDMVNNSTSFTLEKLHSLEVKMKEARKKVRIVESKFSAPLNDERIIGRPLKENNTVAT